MYVTYYCTASLVFVDTNRKPAAATVPYQQNRSETGRPPGTFSSGLSCCRHEIGGFIGFKGKMWLLYVDETPSTHDSAAAGSGESIQVGSWVTYILLPTVSKVQFIGLLQGTTN